MYKSGLLSALRTPSHVCFGRHHGRLLRAWAKGYSTTPLAALEERSSRAIQHQKHNETPRHATRRERLRSAGPFSEFLTDTFDRQHDYLRISVAERCNLRCLYCMPEEGVALSPDRQLLTTPEIIMLSSLFVSQGVTKIRLTGGEPTVRRDILPLMHELGALRKHGLKEICITSNGISLHRKLDSMIEAGLTGVNLSLDTLDPWRFQIMTRRKGLEAVQKSISRILEANRMGAGIKLKINCVIMRGVNDEEIPSFVEMTRDHDIECRFIEYMPFEGNKWNKRKMLGYSEMLDVIKQKYPTLQKAQDHKNDTSKSWHVPGFAGRVGFITSMTENFCGTCNRLRITSDGNLKVCLFGNVEVSVRDVLRESNNNEPIDEEAYQALKQIEWEHGNGIPAPKNSWGTAPNEAKLLQVIGAAVKNKKAKHAGIGNLEHMKNRPMILIDHGDYSLAGTYPSKSSPWGVRGAFLGRNDGTKYQQNVHLRQFHTSRLRYASDDSKDSTENDPQLSHVNETGSARMVSVSEKVVTSRIAVAKCRVRFSNSIAIKLVRENQNKKGDVIGVARVAGIMAAKATPNLIPLCHPIPISHASIDMEIQGEDAMQITATVTYDGKTGVEMEALMAASTAGLTVYDMCKAVDKGMIIDGLQVVRKDGGKSGNWTAE